MIKRRLYLQIYVTIIASLILVVLLTAVSFWIGDESDPEFKDAAIKIAMNALPDANLPFDQQDKVVQKLVNDVDINISLFSPQAELISVQGPAFSFPSEREQKWGWTTQGDTHGWLTELSDGRWLIVSMNSDHNPGSALLKFVLVISSIAMGIGLASYPFVRRITRRLETLKEGVEKVGLGNLQARVSVEGKDEIASLADSFNHATEQIEQLVTSHKTLLANASHELRTPLSRIRLGLEMYHESKDQKRLDALRSDIEELDTLIEEILLMSRLDNSTTNITMEHVDLLDIVEQEATHYSGLEIIGTVAPISGNARLLQRMIRNLIGNAFKHGSSPVVVRLDQSDRFITITVSDHGRGIPASDHDKIFERFYRGSDRQNVEGYGLGLPLVKQIVDAHQGQINILEAEGSSIQIQLPIGQS